jgi:hypothetical protein
VVAPAPKPQPDGTLVSQQDSALAFLAPAGADRIQSEIAGPRAQA